MDKAKLQRLSADIRIWTVKCIASAGFGHIGGSASIADVLAVLYGEEMKIDPKNPKWENRDYFVLSKGHCAPALYATLALKGFFPMDWLYTLNKGGTKLPSHADCKKVPGVDISTGSLGQGMSSAVGIALANKYKKKDSYTYCILGDGETNEGQVWEGAECATHFKLDHFFVFVDWNKKQLDGRIEDVINPVDLKGKFESFGFDTQVCAGYDVEAIYNAIEKGKKVSGKPHAIILDTMKGIGVDFAEAQEFNHYLTFGEAEAKACEAEIENRLANGTYPGGDFYGKNSK